MTDPALRGSLGRRFVGKGKAAGPGDWATYCAPLHGRDGTRGVAKPHPGVPARHNDSPQKGKRALLNDACTFATRTRERSGSDDELHDNLSHVYRLHVPALLLGADDVLVGAPDPTIASVQEEGHQGYYVFATGRGATIFHSSDLRQWKRVGSVFDTPVPSWAVAAVPGTRGIWAPDISRHGDQWRLYYSVSTFGSQRSAIGLAVNKTLNPRDPAYRWEDRGLVIASTPGVDDFNAIDAACFQDRDGQSYLFWGSFWTGIKMIRLSAESGKPGKGEVPTAVAARAAGIDPPAIEGPFVIFRDGYYYLFVSFDMCCQGARSTYKVMVGRSKSVTGPYVDFRGRKMVDGNAALVLASYDRWRGPGHNSVLQTPGNDYLVHHTYDVQDIRAGRILQVRPIYWSPDGWPVVGEPLSPPGPPSPAEDGFPAGRWRHRANYGEPTDLEFLADGTIRGGAGNGRWERDNQRLILRWKDEGAPDGCWVDELVLEPSGKSYVGRNQVGAVIQGLRR